MGTSDSTPEHAANQRAVDAWLDRFFAQYYAARPVNATFIGIHEHDDRLPDVSAAGLARNVSEMRALRTELGGIPMNGVDEVRQADVLLAERKSRTTLSPA